MQSKKKDKKKFIRKNIKFTNIEINDMDEFYDEEIVEDKRATKKESHKMEATLKSGVNLKKGRIIEIKSNYRCLVNIENKQYNCYLGGRLKQLNLESRNIIAVGDYVNVDMSDHPRIEEILERKNALSRFSEDNFQYEIIIAANIDQVIITSSFKQPNLNPGLIDRYICMAEMNNIKPVICVNKLDLIDYNDIAFKTLEFYKKQGYPIIFTSIVTNEGIEKLKHILKNKDSVFSGHSGAGKSSLLNIIQPNLNLNVGQISDYNYKGTHTTTSSKLIKWDFGGYLVDTPGIKTFGFKRADKESIARNFPGFDKLYQHCSFNNCSHIHEKNCAVLNAVDIGKYPIERYESYLRIIDSLEE